MKTKKKLLILLSAVVLTATLITCFALFAGAESVTPEMKITNCSLSFSDSVYIKYAVKTNVDDLKLLVWTEPQANYTIGTEKYTITDHYSEDIDGVSHEIFDLKELSAKMMTDNVYACTYANVGGKDYYSDPSKYSILQYAYNKLGKTATASTSETLKTLLTDMLTYGASAQKHFNYKTTRLATADWYHVKLTKGTLDDGFSQGLYLEGDKVILTAPETDTDGKQFDGWYNSADTKVASTDIATVTVGTKNEVYTPKYAEQEDEYYGITYFNLQGAESPELKGYASHIGVAEENMPKPSRTGYDFVGWYDAIDGGNKVSNIPAGAKDDVHLYARWKLTVYRIDYVDAPNNNNPTEYTIEDEIILNDLEWNGLVFKNWTLSGIAINKIDKGSTGDITLTANWAAGNNVNFEDTQIVHLGDTVNLLSSSASFGNGWSYDAKRSTYKHTGAAGTLDFTLPSDAGDLIFVKFNHANASGASFTGEDSVTVAYGDTNFLSIYDDTTSVEMVLKKGSTDTVFRINALNNITVNISNLQVYKVLESGGTTKEVRALNVSHNLNMLNSQTGFWNVALGSGALDSNINGSRNIALGISSLEDLESGNRNVALGTYALAHAVKANRNIFIGADSGLYLKEANDCVSIGKAALSQGNKRNGDIAIGSCALYGYGTAATSETSEGNIGIGKNSGYYCYGKKNIFIGTNAGYKTSSGIMNVCIGGEAGRNITNGWGNTAIGSNAYINGNYSKSIAIGYGAQPTKSNQAVIGTEDLVETVLHGDLIVVGSDGVKRKIVFNSDGTIGWVTETDTQTSNGK